MSSVKAMQRDRACNEFWSIRVRIRKKSGCQPLSSDIYVICRPWSVRIGKNCARGFEYGPRPRAQFFPIRTDQGWQITCLFFFFGTAFKSNFCVRIIKFTFVLIALVIGIHCLQHFCAVTKSLQRFFSWKFRSGP